MLNRMLPLFSRYYSPCQQLVHGQMGHQELTAVRGQAWLHHRCRNLHWLGRASKESVHAEKACTVDHATACGWLHQVSAFFTQLSMNVLPPGTLTLPLVTGKLEPWTDCTPVPCTPEQDATPLQQWPRRLFMKFLVEATYNAYIIMDSYRAYSRTSHRFMPSTCSCRWPLHAACSQLPPAVHRRVARAQQSDLLRMQGVGPTSKEDCWCSTYHKYLCLHVGSTCWSDYNTKIQFWRWAKPSP